MCISPVTRRRSSGSRVATSLLAVGRLMTLRPWPPVSSDIYTLLVLRRRVGSSLDLVRAASIAGAVRGRRRPPPVGSQRMVDALTSRVRAGGVEMWTSRHVRSLGDLPESRAVLFDLTSRQLERIAGEHFESSYRRRLRSFRYGPGAFKIDYALRGPIPWKSPECARAATVHVGGTYAEVARSESIVAEGRVPDEPFVLVAQSLFDRTRAPVGHHTGGRTVTCPTPQRPT